MTEMQDQLLDFASTDQQAGFRLHGVELFNWGTFHNRVWRLALDGDNALLTGDIGSGKSTLVDALTTLLVPAQRVAYNKAAGAETRERSLRSYVLGYYRSERSDTGHRAKPVALRDHNSYSVVLAEFHNAGYDQTVTLAQVFWFRDPQGQPTRFYVVAERALTIRQHFADFGNDFRQLRKRLRDAPGVQLFDTFNPYEAAFRRLFGLQNDQAMELFHQTVSMKSVGNLTDFVRAHMLEAFPVQPRIDGLLNHFDDLNRAHASVLKARAQIDALTPLVQDCDRYSATADRHQVWIERREALHTWFQHHLTELLEQRLDNLARDHNRQQRQFDQLSDTLHTERGERDQLNHAISRQGGDRLEQLKTELARLGQEQERRQRKAHHYAELAAGLDLPTRPDADTFADSLHALGARRDALSSDSAELENRGTDLAVHMREKKSEHDALHTELESLRQRRSNISARQVAIRERLCSDLGLDPEALPFAGELLRVRDDAGDWEGAAERILHNFALSLLVPDDHYKEVAAWVDRTRLRGRLVYYRVRPPQASAPPDLHPRSLVYKLDIRPDSEFYPWLEQELAKRFDYACCDSLEDFRREARALTPAGQLKSGGQRHEKDDRHALNDRSRYVLGWSNEQKIASLEQQQRQLELAMQGLADELARIDQDKKRLLSQRETLAALLQFEHFSEIDWETTAHEAARLQAERQRLEGASDQLQALTRQLEELEARIQTLDTEREQAGRELARIEEKQRLAQAQRDEAQTDVAAHPEHEPEFQALSEHRAEALGDQQITVEAAANREKDYRDWLQRQIDNQARRLSDLSARILKAMNRYMTDWPLDTREVDASLASGDEFRGMLRALEADDLPRFEERFKALLNENTIREIATFHGQLNKERQLIGERIAQINRSLGEIEYNPGRYILLEAQPNTDAEIREFQQDLRACTEGTTLGVDDDQYAEQKFLQVKAIIERFRGREGTSELDQRWTRKVTDVRQWFTFAASERYREDDSEYEHYTDSGGKSGGQKEKLAYTVLAASLVYQFGLEWGEVRSRSFRFVMIDEAFGRGSDESARFGLELFRRLNLQLLIVTPMQKIHIIEPYVAHLGFVYNPEGRESLLRNLTIEEYQAEMQARERIQVQP